MTTIIPTGSPAWTRTAIHTHYGGHVNKENYLSEGVIDSETDIGAEHIMRLAADMEAMVRVAQFAEITFTCRDTSPDAPLVLSVFMQTGIRSTSYEGDDPPNGFPTLTRLGSGVVRVEFAASYADAYGVVAPFVPSQAVATARSATAAEVTYTIAGSQVTVRAWDAAGAALADQTISLTVW